jgi:thiamine biosynthesis lipoprotein ApbE
VLGLGAPPGRAAWGVALAGAEEPVVELCDRALSVSAQRGRTSCDAAGRKHGHVLDPRTGRSVEWDGTAAVVAESALVAECWSTALLVLAGREAQSGLCFSSGLRVLRASVVPLDLPAGLAAALGTAGGWRFLGPSDAAFVLQPALPA